MKVLNLSSKLLTDKDKFNTSLYSKDQTALLKVLAEEHDVTYEEIIKFLSAIGAFVKKHMKEEKIVHIQQFGKFIPVIKNEDGRRVRKKRVTYNKSREEESDS